MLYENVAPYPLSRFHSNPLSSFSVSDKKYLFDMKSDLRDPALIYLHKLLSATIGKKYSFGSCFEVGRRLFTWITYLKFFCLCSRNSTELFGNLMMS